MRLDATLSIGLVLAALICGCTFSRRSIVPSPLSYKEQERAILERVPLGTSRDDALAQLDEAGIEGTFGVSQTTYYCDLWERDGGRKWQLDVALLFDDAGRLYGVRPAAAKTGITTETDRSTRTATESSVAAGTADDQILESSPAAPKGSDGMAAGESSAGTSDGSRRSAERSPFTDAEEPR